MNRRSFLVPAGVRLPTTRGVRPYDPPASPPLPPMPPPEQGVAETYEASTVPVAFKATRGNAARVSQELVVYKTRRRWRACDVYVDASQLPLKTGALIRVIVYAVSAAGARTIVASGGVEQDGGNGAVQFFPAWVAAARAQAEFFEVTATYVDFADAPGTVLEGTFNVTVVASDIADPPPAHVGVMTSRTEWFSAAPFIVPAMELVGFSAINNAAAAIRFVQLVEGSGAVGGKNAALQWAIEAVQGKCLVVDGINWRTRNLLNSLCLEGSSTAGVVTVAADVILSAWWR